MKKIISLLFLLIFILFPSLTYADFPNWSPITFTASNVTLDSTTNSVTFNVNPADFTGFPTTNMDVRLTNVAMDSGWYTNNIDVTNCLSTGSCSFSNLQQNNYPPGSPIIGGEYQIGFFPDGNFGAVRWSKIISVPFSHPSWTPIKFTASNVTLDSTTNSVTFNVNPGDFTGFPTTNMDIRVSNSEFDSGWFVNNQDISTCISTGNCSFPDLQQYLLPPGAPIAGSAYQIGFFPDGNFGAIWWSQVIFNQTPPQVGSVNINGNPVQINTAVTASTTFTDPDVEQTHTATANWGDGTNIATSCTVTEQSGSTPGSVNCPFSGYASANVYPVTITVSDGTAQTISPITYVSVYAPTQSSIFSAGSNYDNPSTASPNTSGKVKFGLSYKYQGDLSSGNRAFSMDFNNANLHFNGMSVTSLVISNGIATLEGSGTLMGQTGTYNFLVTGVNGGGIRIQITDASNNVVYDTQPGAPINATPTTNINGNVVVH